VTVVAALQVKTLISPVLLHEAREFLYPSQKFKSTTILRFRAMETSFTQNAIVANLTLSSLP
jgi:hypothetical protein